MLFIFQVMSINFCEAALYEQDFTKGNVKKELKPIQETPFRNKKMFQISTLVDPCYFPNSKELAPYWICKKHLDNKKNFAIGSWSSKNLFLAKNQAKALAVSELVSQTTINYKGSIEHKAKVTKKSTGINEESLFVINNNLDYVANLKNVAVIAETFDSEGVLYVLVTIEHKVK